MTWPNWNWESLETVAIIFGAIGFVIVYVRVADWLGIEGGSDCSLHPLGDDFTRLNPSTGLTMNGPTDAGGSLYGESAFSHHESSCSTFSHDDHLRH